jgi:hypothetical protein
LGRHNNKLLNHYTCSYYVCNREKASLNVDVGLLTALIKEAKMAATRKQEHYRDSRTGEFLSPERAKRMNQDRVEREVIKHPVKPKPAK